jgi:predicted nucleic-acid-binding Zn-ribbon protein
MYHNATQLQIDWTEFENIIYFNSRYHSKINFSILKTDAINGYGKKVLYEVSLDVFNEICNKCGYSTFYKKQPIIECGRHSWDKKFSSIAYGDSKLNFKNALEALDEKLEELRIRLNK